MLPILGRLCADSKRATSPRSGRRWKAPTQVPLDAASKPSHRPPDSARARAASKRPRTRREWRATPALRTARASGSPSLARTWKKLVGSWKGSSPSCSSREAWHRSGRADGGRRRASRSVGVGDTSGFRRLEAGGMDQPFDRRRSRVVVGGVEEHGLLRVAICSAGEGVRGEGAECLDVVRACGELNHRADGLFGTLVPNG
jgi:hypothetical protein